MSLLCCSMSLSSARRASVSRRDLSSWDPSSNSSSFTCHVPAMTGFIHLHVPSLWALGFSQHSCWFNIPNQKPRQKLWGFCCPSPGRHSIISTTGHKRVTKASPHSRVGGRAHLPIQESYKATLPCVEQRAASSLVLPVAKTPSSQWRTPGFNPSSGK